MKPPSPFEIHPLDDLAVHALDALDDPERRELEHHLARCPACRTELDALRSTAARLVRPVAPPPQLWLDIATSLPPTAAPRPAPRPTTAPPEGDGLSPPGPASRLGSGAAGSGGGAAGPSAPPGPSDDDLAPTWASGAVGAGGGDTDRRGLAGARGGGAGTGEPVAPGPGRRRHTSPAGRGRARGRRQLAGVLAAAAAVAVLAGAVGFVAGRAGERSPSSGSSGVVALAEAALADGGNPRVELTGGDGVEAAQLVTDADSGVGYVVLDALAPLPQGSTYQLWRLDGPTPVSLGVLGDGTASALAVSLPPSLPHETAQLAITAENGGGAARPTGPVVASGFLPAAA